MVVKGKSALQGENMLEECLPRVGYHVSKHIATLQQEGDLEEIIIAGLEGLIEGLKEVGQVAGKTSLAVIDSKVKRKLRQKTGAGRGGSHPSGAGSRRLAGAVTPERECAAGFIRVEDVAHFFGISLPRLLELMNLSDVLNGKICDWLHLKEDAGRDLFIDLDKESADAWKRGELRELLVREISMLPEREKLVLSLYYEENLSFYEIGDVIDLSESEVSWLFGSAVIKLHSRLEKTSLR